jgi:hypothetical protein
MITIFGDFWRISGQKIGDLLDNPCYESFFAQTCSQEANAFSVFSAKIFQKS